uniref:Guanylate cyclase n=1 Tax=Parastrongyloides trichosuri TaxID=131310 RepID=A0A0N4Z104_PARTI
MKVLVVILSLLVIIYSQTNHTRPPFGVIRLGFLFSKNTERLREWQNYQGTAYVVMNALDYARLNSTVLGFVDFQFSWEYTECNVPLSAGKTFELINLDIGGIDVLLGPSCAEAAEVCINIGAFYNFPVYLWSVFKIVEEDTANVVKITPGFDDYARAVCEVLSTFNFTTFSFVYFSSVERLEKCFRFADSLNDILSSEYQDLNLIVSKQLSYFDSPNLNSLAKRIKSRSRIVIVCGDLYEELRKLYLTFYDNGMCSDEYVYFNIDADMDYYVNMENYNIFVDYNKPSDGRDKDALKMAHYMFHFQFSMRGGISKYFNKLRSVSKEKMAKEPFNCTDECADYNIGTKYSGYLFDAAYVFYISLAKLMEENGEDFSITHLAKNGNLLTEYSRGTYQGVTGEFIIGNDFRRNSEFSLSTYDDNGYNISTWMYIINNDPIQINEMYTDPSKTLWEHWGGNKPSNIPKCGYEGEFCLLPFYQSDPVGFGITITGSILLLIIIILMIIFFMYSKKNEEKKQNELWNISYLKLCVFADNRDIKRGSKRSLQSYSQTSQKINNLNSDSGKFQLYQYNNEVIVGHSFGITYQLKKQDMKHLRILKMLDHENLNSFIGYSIDGPGPMDFFKYCSRGNLRDVFCTDSTGMAIDSFFIYTIIKDIVDGIYYIHHSPIVFHGFLTSKNCLVDERWQVKISDYGIPFIRSLEKKDVENLIWSAPELVREEIMMPNQACDIFSLAIIISEVVNQKEAYENSNIQGGADEVIYMIKRHKIVRPILEPKLIDMPPALIHLVKDMWSDYVDERPSINTIKKLIKEMNSGKSKNLMDHVFSMLENHTTSLEEEIHERTKELVEEKKKADILLSRMLPASVAEKLKAGSTVTPEMYDSVTIFFSDVVSFTTLASKCTPLQVVNLLNNLYTTFDTIINEHDVYKVETIGDGYLCVSGLPNKNGFLHVKEIADLSLELIKSLEDFKISHLPNEKLRIRVGIHSGSCVAGVVGLTMPRYCLFGDTVNTASRMESNGKPNSIHMSSDAHKLLTEEIGGYITELRGEVIIKGKGVMTTYWLISKENGQIFDKQTGMYSDYKNRK